ncbi:hypothetical protein J6590_098688 [Homalodisca vitripennis]|nr:hypothetical protein J6590_098688 [Homalodisca vitripennis]
MVALKLPKPASQGTGKIPRLFVCLHGISKTDSPIDLVVCMKQSRISVKVLRAALKPGPVYHLTAGKCTHRTYWPHFQDQLILTANVLHKCRAIVLVHRKDQCWKLTTPLSKGTGMRYGTHYCILPHGLLTAALTILSLRKPVLE